MTGGLLLRCELAKALQEWMDSAGEGCTQVQAAKRLGVAQPRVPEIAHKEVDRLSLDYLGGSRAKAGTPVTVRMAA